MATAESVLSQFPSRRPVRDLNVFVGAIAGLAGERIPAPSSSDEMTTSQLVGATALFALIMVLLALVPFALIRRAHAEPVPTSVPAPAPAFSVRAAGALPVIAGSGRLVLMTVDLEAEAARAHGNRQRAQFDKLAEHGEEYMKVSKQNAVAAATACLGHPLKAKIETGNITGASGGMIFALTIVDQLTPGDLTRGAAVAGTGVISPDGRIGTVLSLRDKAIAARKMHADIFLVPAAQVNEARAAVPGLRVVGVHTLAEAISVLSPGSGCPSNRKAA